MLNNLIAALASMLIASGCAVPQQTLLPPHTLDGVESIQTVLFIPQSDLDIDVTASNPGATGLLGALVAQAFDASRRAGAQKSQAGILQELGGFDFRGRMLRHMTGEFARVPSPRLQAAELETVDSESQRRIDYDRSSAPAILFTHVNYRLIDSKLIVIATSRVYPKARALLALRTQPDDASPLAEGNAIYRGIFSFTKQAITQQNIRDGLVEGMTSVAWQLAADLNRAGSGDPTALLRPLAPTPDALPRSITAAAEVVRPAVTPSLPIAPRPRLDDSSMLPYVSDKGREAYRRWLGRPLPRAFAVSRQGQWFASWGAVPADPSMPIDVAARALAHCARASGQCELYAVNQEVVYRGSGYQIEGAPH